MAQPFLEHPRHARSVHGDDGLGDLGIPASPRQLEAVHAVEFLYRTLRAAAEPVTLVPIAPLTNIAALFLQYPEVKANVSEIVLMGGAAATMGNATAVAEFNIRHDPEAADIVFRSGLPIVMYGLDVFRAITFTRAEADEMAAASSTAAQLAGRLLLSRMEVFGRSEAGIGDAGAVASVIEPDGLTTELRPVMVELSGTWTRGQTVVDRRERPIAERNVPWQPLMQPNARVALAVDRERYRRLFREAVLGARGD
jgi:pyrimidine-specific ribonucleoside hydrolase